MTLKDLGVALAAGCLGGSAVWLLQRGNFSLYPVGLTYEQLAATLLGGAGLLIAVVGLFVAVMAIWGFREISERAVAAAQRASVAKIEEVMSSPEVKRQIEVATVNFLSTGVAEGTLRSWLEEVLARNEGLRDVDAEWAGSVGGDGDDQ